MKRTTKLAILTAAASAAVIAIPTTTLAILSNQRKVQKTSPVLNTITYDLNNELKSNSSILELQDKADINLYFSTYGIMPFFNLVRLAMLSKSEVHFLYTSKLLFQKPLNKEFFEDFLKNVRKLPTEQDPSSAQNSYNKSTVEDLGSISDLEAIKYFEKIIAANPDKKINFFMNSDHFRNEMEYSNLVNKYHNVAIVGIEDSLATGQWVSQRYVPLVYDLYLDAQTGLPLKNAPKYIDRISQYLITNFYPNIVSYLSEYDAVKSLTNKKIRNIKPFFEQEKGATGENLSPKEIKDFIFSTRDRNNKRLFTHWGKIIGLDWEKERDIVKGDYQQNQKPSIIIIGTSYDSDIDRVKYIASKYAQDYNIYYKGHPGHNYSASYINEHLDPKNIGKEINFVNPENGKNDVWLIKEGQIVRALETQIASEELTTDHVLDENPLRFEKWVLLTFRTSAISGIDNGFNAPGDVLEIFLENQAAPINIGTNLYEEYNKKLITDYIATKSLSITIKEQSVNKPRNKLEISDFEVHKISNAEKERFFFNDIQINKIVTSELNENGNAWKVLFELQARSSVKEPDKIYTFNKQIELPLN
ncbi:hypothetical protein [Mycoplasmopsis gallinacea]|uniref:Lipoprotein n=1 Tax=Mycoplasmopsis gallinacea TaxID=29556 RepID=A0A449A336_9BACT|nr:hypothetical protein [Mycoplasmopsis gallinacea]VEU58604.1 Uncharacterised protein [Mycoplasmopsis gallinacea]